MMLNRKVISFINEIKTKKLVKKLLKWPAKKAAYHLMSLPWVEIITALGEFPKKEFKAVIAVINRQGYVQAVSCHTRADAAISRRVLKDQNFKNGSALMLTNYDLVDVPPVLNELPQTKLKLLLSYFNAELSAKLFMFLTDKNREDIFYQLEHKDRLKLLFKLENKLVVQLVGKYETKDISAFLLQTKTYPAGKLLVSFPLKIQSAVAKTWEPDTLAGIISRTSAKKSVALLHSLNKKLFCQVINLVDIIWLTEFLAVFSPEQRGELIDIIHLDQLAAVLSYSKDKEVDNSIIKRFEGVQNYNGRQIPKMPDHFHAFSIKGSHVDLITDKVNKKAVKKLTNELFDLAENPNKLLLQAKNTGFLSPQGRKLLKNNIHRLLVTYEALKLADPKDYSKREKLAAERTAGLKSLNLDQLVKYVEKKLIDLHEEFAYAGQISLIHNYHEKAAMLLDKYYLHRILNIEPGLLADLRSADIHKVLQGLDQIFSDRVNICIGAFWYSHLYFNFFKKDLINNLKTIKLIDGLDLIPLLRKTDSMGELEDILRQKIIELNRPNAKHRHFASKLAKRLKYFPGGKYITDAQAFIKRELSKITEIETTIGKEILFKPAKDASLLFKGSIGKDCSAGSLSKKHLFDPHSRFYKLIMKSEWHGYLTLLEMENTLDEKALVIDVFNVDTTLNTNYKRLWQQLVAELGKIAKKAGAKWVLAAKDPRLVSNQDYIRKPYNELYKHNATKIIGFTPGSGFQTEQVHKHLILWQDPKIKEKNDAQ